MNSHATSRAGRLALVASLSLTLGACAKFGEKVLPRNLPIAPAYAVPVEVAEPKRNEDPVNVAARERAGRAKANRIIRDFGKWYSCVQAEYAEQNGETCQ